jgi:predicted RecB family endonuclease
LNAGSASRQCQSGSSWVSGSPPSDSPLLSSWVGCSATSLRLCLDGSMNSFAVWLLLVSASVARAESVDDGAVVAERLATREDVLQGQKDRPRPSCARRRCWPTDADGSEHATGEPPRARQRAARTHHSSSVPSYSCTLCGPVPA